jgi:hypothetical protein
MKRMWTAALLLAATATVAAAAEGPYANFLALQLTNGTADLATLNPFPGDPLNPPIAAPAYDHSEYGFKLEYWRMMGPEYAFNISGGLGLFGEEDKPADTAPVGTGNFNYTQNSWHFRVGGDRLLSVSPKTYIFFGPGIEYWSGKAKFEDETPPGFTYETKNITRISIGARLGGHLMVGPTWGITAQVGTKVGRATYKESGAETTWWPSSMEGAVGLVFKIGG